MPVPSIPEGKYVDIAPDRRVHYHEAGEGPAVIYVHGSGPGASGWSNFKQNYEVLAAAGYRTLVPDLLGYGYSSMPAEAKYTWDDVVSGIREFARALGIESATLIGNSMGGAICVEIATEDPDFVDKLVLMAPGGLEPVETYMKMRGIRRMLKAMYSPDGLTRKSMRMVFELQLHDPTLITETIIDERMQIAELQPKGMFEKMRVPNVEERLKDIACPVLGFWGMDDYFCPVSGAMRVMEGCKDVKMTLLTGCGHWVMVEHADVFNASCARFLNGQP